MTDRLPSVISGSGDKPGLMNASWDTPPVGDEPVPVPQRVAFRRVRAEQVARTRPGARRPPALAPLCAHIRSGRAVAGAGARPRDAVRSVG